jgi:hypothetical protein
MERLRKEEVSATAGRARCYRGGLFDCNEGDAAGESQSYQGGRATCASGRLREDGGFQQLPLPPLSGAGKILKRELRKPYWEGKGRAVS